MQEMPRMLPIDQVSYRDSTANTGVYISPNSYSANMHMYSWLGRAYAHLRAGGGVSTLESLNRFMNCSR